MSTSLLLTEESQAVFTVTGSQGTGAGTAALSAGTVAIAPTSSPGYTGTVTWTLGTDPNCTINSKKVVLSLDNVTVSATSPPYSTAIAGSGSISGSKIAKVTMSDEVPMCVADGPSLSIDGKCSYVDEHSQPHTDTYTLTCVFVAVQTKVSGLTN